MFVWTKRLLGRIESNLSCPKCGNITGQNISARACIPWMAIECSKCSSIINCSVTRGCIQVIFSVVVMYMTAITFPSSEISYARNILSMGLGNYAISGYILVVVCGIGKCD